MVETLVREIKHYFPLNGNPELFRRLLEEGLIKPDGELIPSKPLPIEYINYVEII